MLTLVQNFYVPFMREVLLLHGVCNCARKTCLNLLSKCAAGPFLKPLGRQYTCSLNVGVLLQLYVQLKMTRESRE